MLSQHIVHSSDIKQAITQSTLDFLCRTLIQASPRPEGDIVSEQLNSLTILCPEFVAILVHEWNTVLQHLTERESNPPKMVSLLSRHQILFLIVKYFNCYCFKIIFMLLLLFIDLFGSIR